MSEAPRFIALSPVIPVRDMATSVTFYTEKLGFAHAFDDGDGAGGPVSYAGVCRSGLCFHLQQMVEGQGDGMPLIRVRVEGVGALYREYIEAGAVEDRGPLSPTAWGTTEFGVWDPNGAGVVFYQDLSAESRSNGVGTAP